MAALKTLGPVSLKFDDYGEFETSALTFLMGVAISETFNCPSKSAARDDNHLILMTLT
jgi:hypothetical protein